MFKFEGLYYATQTGYNVWHDNKHYTFVYDIITGVIQFSLNTKTENSNNFATQHICGDFYFCVNQNIFVNKVYNVCINDYIFTKLNNFLQNTDFVIVEIATAISDNDYFIKIKIVLINDNNKIANLSYVADCIKKQNIVTKTNFDITQYQPQLKEFYKHVHDFVNNEFMVLIAN